MWTIRSAKPRIVCAVEQPWGFGRCDCCSSGPANRTATNATRERSVPRRRATGPASGRRGRKEGRSRARLDRPNRLCALRAWVGRRRRRSGTRGRAGSWLAHRPGLRQVLASREQVPQPTRNRRRELTRAQGSIPHDSRRHRRRRSGARALLLRAPARLSASLRPSRALGLDGGDALGHSPGANEGELEDAHSAAPVTPGLVLRTGPIANETGPLGIGARPPSRSTGRRPSPGPGPRAGPRHGYAMARVRAARRRTS